MKKIRKINKNKTPTAVEDEVIIQFKNDIYPHQIAENLNLSYSTVYKILNQKEFDMSEILDYVKEETNFKSEHSEVKMGFLK